MITQLKADYLRYGNTTLKSFFKSLLLAHGFHAMIIYRFGRWSNKQIFLFRYLFLFIHFVLEKLINAMYGIHISINAEIEPGLYIGHFGGIHIGACKIGAHSSVQERVYIDKNVDGYPNIGTRVWIGAQTKIIGPISVGDGSSTAAGSIVEDNIPCRCLVAGDPARIIRTDYDNSSFL